MSKESKLEQIGKKYRDNSLIVHGEQIKAFARNDYSKNDPYNENHKDAVWDESITTPDGKPLGKGTGDGGHGHSIPNQNLPSDLYVPQFNMEQGGGSYDRWGRKEFKSGREYLQAISLYNKENQYTQDTVSVDEFIDGQYIVK